MQQAFFAVNQPTRSASCPRLLPPDLLPAANSLNMTVMQAGAIAGPLVGGALIPVLGFSALYLVDTCTLFATLWAVIRLPALPIEGSAGTAPGLRAVLDGFGYLRGHPVLLMSFVVDIIAMVFGMPRALFPQIAHESFGGPPDGGLAFALLFAGIPAGAVLGGVFSGWVSRVRRQGRAVVGAIVVWGLAMTAFGGAVGLAPRARTSMLVVAVLMLVVGGAADMASSAFRNSMLQSAASDAVRGRLQGVFIVVVAGGPRIADVLHGARGCRGRHGADRGLGGLLVLVVLAVAVRAASPAFLRLPPRAGRDAGLVTPVSDVARAARVELLARCSAWSRRFGQVRRSGTTSRIRFDARGRGPVSFRRLPPRPPRPRPIWCASDF